MRNLEKATDIYFAPDGVSDGFSASTDTSISKEDKGIVDPWQEKVDKTPFGRIEVSIMLKPISYRRIMGEDFDRLADLIDEVSFSNTKRILNYHIKSMQLAAEIDEDEDEDMVNTKLEQFRLEYVFDISSSTGFYIEEISTSLGFLRDQIDNNQFGKETSEQQLNQLGANLFNKDILPLFIDATEGTIISNPETFIYRYKKEEYASEITTEDSESMSKDLSHLEGKLTDRQVFIDRFTSIMNRHISDRNNFEDPLTEAEVAYIKAKGISTHFDLAKAVFGDYLTYSDMSEIGVALLKAVSIDEAVKTLESFKRKPSVDLISQEKLIRAKISEALETDKELLPDLNKEFEKIKEAKRHSAKIMQCMTDYFTLPDMAVQYFRNKIKSMQGILVKKINRGNNTDVIYLDATPDNNLDRDPGAISGDCTEGHPLPFLDPNIPAYNVKVFDSKNCHIGNLYLLVSKAYYRKYIDDDDEDDNNFNEVYLGRIWHLDAIQIPIENIDPRSLKIIFERIGVEAVKQGISCLTINTGSKISNYDYIRDPLSWRKDYQQEVRVDIPIVDDSKYSHFQGNGDAFIVWGKEVGYIE